MLYNRRSAATVQKCGLESAKFQHAVKFQVSRPPPRGRYDAPDQCKAWRETDDQLFRET